MICGREAASASANRSAFPIGLFFWVSLVNNILIILIIFNSSFSFDIDPVELNL